MIKFYIPIIISFLLGILIAALIFGILNLPIVINTEVAILLHSLLFTAVIAYIFSKFIDGT